MRSNEDKKKMRQAWRYLWDSNKEDIKEMAVSVFLVLLGVFGVAIMLLGWAYASYAVSAATGIPLATVTTTTFTETVTAMVACALIYSIANRKANDLEGTAGTHISPNSRVIVYSVPSMVLFVVITFVLYLTPAKTLQGLWTVVAAAAILIVGSVSMLYRAFRRGVLEDGYLDRVRNRIGTDRHIHEGKDA